MYLSFVCAMAFSVPAWSGAMSTGGASARGSDVQTMRGARRLKSLHGVHLLREALIAQVVGRDEECTTHALEGGGERRLVVSEARAADSDALRRVLGE